MKLIIPKPCHENWNAMTPVEKGRFCSVCRKTVKDFTKLSDDEIIQDLGIDSDICVNATSDQLNRNLNYSFINSLFTKFAVGFILTSGGIIAVNAQESLIKKEGVKIIDLLERSGFDFNKREEVLIKNQKVILNVLEYIIIQYQEKNINLNEEEWSYLINKSVEK